MSTREELAKKVEELQAERERAIAPLLDIQATRRDLYQQLAATDKPYAEAYVAAEAAGWGQPELLALDIEEPAKRPRGRPRKRAAKKTTSVEAPSPNTSDEEQGPDPSQP